VKTIVKMKFGSHLYGLNTPESDTDYKGIYIPDLKDIVLQRVPKTSINMSTGSADGKNTKEDVDTEMFTLQGFIKMCAQGQTAAVDMLFAPEEMIIESSFEWRRIQEQRDKLITGKAAAFVGYCYQQANKYGIKGSRINAIDTVLAFLSKKDPDMKLYIPYHSMSQALDGVKHVEFIKLPVKKGSDKKVNAVEVCGRKFDVSVKISYMINALEKIKDNYGDRAQLAKKNKGIDWKAISHAMRVCMEAEELLTTGRVTFPFTGRKKNYLLNIKKGVLEYDSVAHSLEEYMQLIRQLEETTTLPRQIDVDYWDNFIYNVYTRSR